MPKRQNKTSSVKPLSSMLSRLLLVFLVLAVVPLAGVGYYVNQELDQVRETVNRAATTYERRAQTVAGRVSFFLGKCEKDLLELAKLERSDDAYLKFANRKKREVWIRGGTNDQITEERKKIPLYKEVSFIDTTGGEQILIREGEIVPPSGLRDVSKPENTTYRSEKYFNETIDNKEGEIYVSHLNGFHLDKFETLGLEKIIERLDSIDDHTKRVYRYLKYEMLVEAGLVEYVSSFDEDEKMIRVYRRPGEESRVLVVDPGQLEPGELQSKRNELEKLVVGLAPEDVVEGQRYDGVLRFALPVFDGSGARAGVISLALDHMHLMQFTQHVKAMQPDAVAFAGYRSADYTYLFDDEGWIITHPKMWDIRGVDHQGKQVPHFSESTSPAERLVGLIPIDLTRLDWRVGEGYSKVVREPREGKTGTAWHYNLGGVPRTRIYAPIFYDTGDYAKYGIFGGVMLGTDSQTFISLMQEMNTRIPVQIAKLRRTIYWLFSLLLVAVALLSVIAARGLIKPLRQFSEAARRIGEGDLDTPIQSGRKDEIGVLASSFEEMVGNLKQSFKELEGRNEDLKQAQKKLLKAEREKQKQLQKEVVELQKEIAGASFANMIVESPEMKKIQEEIVRVASSSATVVIQGDNGTGKELVAEAIHRNSTRKDKKFLKVNCAAFNDNLLDSELFGHKKGSFTGATVDRQGLFESANGGTLLLDEIGDMSLEMQKKLLRTLQEGEVIPLGASRVVKVDVRLLAATNRDLASLMKRGKFREDLFHRLNVISIHIPPLRERKQDILPLTHLFTQRFADAENKPITGIAVAAEKMLMDYPWPGNVRELEHSVERAVIRSLSNELTSEDFQLTTRKEMDGKPRSDDERTLAEVEKAHILEVLGQQGGNKKTTAEILGIGYNTLWRKLKKYDQG